MLGGLGLVFMSAGLLTVTAGFNSGYTRKICHLALFASTPLVMFLWPHRGVSPSEAQWNTLWSAWMSFVPFYALVKPVRRRFTAAMLCFRAVDREQDRPHTLEWLVSQGVAGFFAIIGIMIFLARTAQGDTPKQKNARVILVMIPILINGLGDGLAEPVGIRFGRHKYKTRALWYQGRCCAGSFTRSLEVRGPCARGRASATRREPCPVSAPAPLLHPPFTRARAHGRPAPAQGSLCVFLTGVLTVGMFRTFYSDVQFAVAMGAIPMALTLAEAFSPHTWDTPFIIAVGGIILGLIEALVPGCGAQCLNKISFFGVGAYGK